MQATVLASYVRHYSDIPPFQKHSRVTYALLQSSDGLYISVHCDRAESPAALCMLPGMSAPPARDLLRYLYENAVPAVHVPDVVGELCPSARGGVAGTEAR